MIYRRLHVISSISRNLYFPANTNSLHLKLECIMERIFNKKNFIFRGKYLSFQIFMEYIYIYEKKIYIYFLINRKYERRD